ncbi:MAG: NAD-dependent epimerase/dehydratase family protein [Puniceicoccaceae bacterium]
MHFDQSNILVVGGAGFVGSNLCRKLLAHSGLHSLLVVDNFLSSEPFNLPKDPRLVLIKGSIADDAVLKQLPTDLDYVFHLACFHGNQSSIHSPLEDHANNTLTSLKLFEQIYNMSSLKKVIYSSAGCAVSEKTADTAKATVEDAPNSLFHDSPYSISKIIGEMYGNYYFTRYGMPFVKARFQNVYGPGEVLGSGQWRGTRHTVWRNVTPTFIWKSLHGQPLPLENGGVATRDFIFVADIVDGLLACALRGTPGEAYNLATGEETSIRHWASMINVLTGNPANLQVEAPRDWDHSIKRFGSTDKAKQELGFEAKYTGEAGLRKTIEWTVDNRARIRETMLKHLKHLPELKTLP